MPFVDRVHFLFDEGNSSVKQKTVLLVGVLLVISAAVRIFVLLNTDNFAGSVTMGRVVQAIAILENPSLRSNFDGNSSMLYAYLLAGVLGVWPAPFFAPRIFSLVFGVLTVIPFFYVVRGFFSERVAFFSGVLLCLFPLHAIQSTLSMADVFFYFFFFCGVYYYLKFREDPGRVSVVWLLWSSLYLNIAALLRFESWCLLPLFVLFLLKKGKRYAVFFLIMVSVAPLLWLYINYHYTGDMFYSFVASSQSAYREIMLHRVPYSRELWRWLAILSQTITPFVVISGIAGIGYALWKKKSVFLAVVFIFLFSVYEINTFLMRMWHNERYMILLGIMFFPYSLFCVEKIALWIRARPALVMSVYVLLIAVGLKSSFVRLQPVHKAPVIVRQVGQWLKQHVAPSARVILGEDQWTTCSQDIIVWSGIPSRNFLLTSPLDPTREATMKRVSDFMVFDHPQYLILNWGGYLQEVLQFPVSGTATAFGCTFQPVHMFQECPDYGVFTVYKISYLQ